MQRDYSANAKNSSTPVPWVSVTIALVVIVLVIGLMFGLSLGADFSSSGQLPSIAALMNVVTILGVLITVIVALGQMKQTSAIANESISEQKQNMEDQLNNERAQDAVRCIHYAIVVTEDLKQKVSHLKKNLLAEGSPLFVQIKTIEAIQARYECLFDKDLYRHLPGELSGAVIALSGFFHGQNCLSYGITLSKSCLLKTTDAFQGDAPIIKSLDSCIDQLNALIDGLREASPSKSVGTGPTENAVIKQSANNIS